MRARLVGPDDATWATALGRCAHDVHHRPAWGRASTYIEDGDPCAVVVEAGGDTRCLVPLLVRDLGDGRSDAVSPYGYAGPAFPFAMSRDARREALAVAMTALAREGCIAVFLRLHPLLDDGWSEGAEGVREHGQTVSIDLAEDDASFRRGLRAGHRGDIDRAERDGVRVEMTSGVEGRVALRVFQGIYRATMDRVGADASYLFPDAYFAALADGLGEDLLVALARDREGVPVAGALFTTEPSSGLAQYHLSGTAGGSGLQATKLVIAAARATLRYRGARVLHLGGGRGADEDSLFRFKAGFSSRRHRYRSLRTVLDPVAYARLCADAGVDPSTGDAGYFPAYRDRSRPATFDRDTVEGDG